MISNLLNHRILNISNLISIFHSHIYSKGFIKKINNHYFNLNLKKNYLIVSLDCDTIEDLYSIPSLHKKLNQFNIKPSYAVPGELILKDKYLFNELALQGVEFINHGFNIHTTFNSETNKYKSTHFYNNYSYNEIKEDIIKGHNTICEVLNYKPQGFRTPHFGTISNLKLKDFIYKILRDLNYIYSTSTTSLDMYWSGAIFKRHDIIEVPLTGSYNKPHIILDSWNFMHSEKKQFDNNDYYMQIKKIIENFSVNNIMSIVNIYVDPSHANNWESFLESMKLFKDFKKTNYLEISKNFKNNLL